MVIHRDQKGGYFNLIVYPPVELKEQPRQPLEMVFLLDVSGSMSGQPIGQSKAAMRYAMSHMNPQDTFQVITFSGNNRVLFDRPQPVTAENIRRASQFIEGSEAGGGTEMLKAISVALDGEREPGRGRVIVFLTDGYVGNEDQILRMTAQKLNGARIFAFGVGSSTNRFLMDGLARIGRGTVAYLGLRDSGEDVMQLYFERVAHPAMTDISVDFGQMKVAGMSPSRVADLFVGRPITLTGKFDGELPREIRISGIVGDRRISMTVPLDDQDQTNPALAAIWARQRITDLSEQIFVTPNEAGVCEELIRRTALEYGLMSKYTAFIAVDSSRRTEGDHGTSVAVPVAMPEGVKYETTVK
jgi:Ca-activated chloride channel family protein